MSTYQTPGATTLRLRLAAGEIEVTTGDVAATTVQIDVLRGDPSAADEVFQGSRPTVDGGTEVRVEAPTRTKLFGREPVYRFRLTAPNGSKLEARTVSGGIRARGRFGSADLRTTSGSIDAERVEGHASARTASGSIEFADIGGDAEARTVSGSIRIGRVGGALRANSVSGSIETGAARGIVSAETVSGRVAIERLGAGDARFRSVSGSVALAIEPGLRIWMDVASTSGRTTSELSPDEGPAAGGETPSLELRVNTVSGSVHLAIAPKATAA
jgi:DUF4097 and DUF4098 domain-containing protein YvlB